jgi:D-alanyl-D-alanine carboxypeptidase/D-alanyl-D-alanine-endopeptidase (penicillin-binding protein 4)
VDRRLSFDPARAALVLFRRALLAAGVQVGTSRVVGVTPRGAPLLASTPSPPLATLVTWMLKHSDNYVAEMLLKQLGAQIGGAGTSAVGASIVRQELAGAGLDTTGAQIVDGSGLSQEDRVTARTLAGLLVLLRADAKVGPLLESALPVAGVDGTLHHRLLGTKLAGVVRAKTGTTDESSGLAGYLGDRYAFVVIENGGFVPAWVAHVAQDRFLRVLGSAR